MKRLRIKQSTLNTKVKIDYSLSRLKDKVLAPEKVAQANHVLSLGGLPQ